MIFTCSLKMGFNLRMVNIILELFAWFYMKMFHFTNVVASENVARGYDVVTIYKDVRISQI